MDWCLLRLADLRERSGIPVEVLALYVSHYHYGEGPRAVWRMHAGGECVISEPSIAAAVRALRSELHKKGGAQ